MSTHTTLARAEIRRLLDYLKSQQAQIAETLRGGIFPSNAMAELKQHVWKTCNRPPCIDHNGRPYPDVQAVIDANIRYMNQRGDPEELDRLIREVERIVSARSERHGRSEEQAMQNQRALRVLKERIAGLRNWEAQQVAELDEWAEYTGGATLPEVDAFSEAFGVHRQELQMAAEAIAALERLGTAIDTLGDAREHKSLIETYDTSLGALERRLVLDKRGNAHGSVIATQTTAGNLLEPAREAVNAEAKRRRCEAAEREARAHEEAERREAEERRRKALAEGEAARAVLVKALPEAGEALAPATSGTA